MELNASALATDPDVHLRDVADIFSSMLEIEIVALKKMLKSSTYQLFVAHPITNKPVAIGLDHIQRREEQCRIENDLSIIGAATSAQSQEYTEIDYGYLKLEGRKRRLQLSFRHRRRCILLSALSVTLVLVVAAISAVLLSTFLRSPPPDVILTTDCILLVGGVSSSSGVSLEYYNPNDGVECDVEAIGRMSDHLLSDTTVTSGCYLSRTDHIVVREAKEPDKPPILYGLKRGSAVQLPLPFGEATEGKEYTWGSTAAGVRASTCLSCGGWNGGWYLRQCFQFDSVLNASSWTPLSPLPQQLAYAASVSPDNTSYYVVGGWNGTQLRSLYRYDVRKDSWEERKALDSGRQWHSAVALSNTELLVCGGFLWRADCRMYDVSADEWYNVSSMSVNRQYFAMVRLNGSVYAIGGEGAQYEQLSSVERYDQTADKWTLVKRLTHGRMNFIAVVV